MLLGLREYKEFALQNVADSDLVLPDLQEKEVIEVDESDPLNNEQIDQILEKFRKILGDRVIEVRETDRLTNSVARLVDQKGSLGQEYQRVYRMMDREYQIPKKILEVNPSHIILKQLGDLENDDPLGDIIIEQIFASSLLVEGLHPDPAAMIPRIQELIGIALQRKS
jgi:molecular chaperone HtpG